MGIGPEISGGPGRISPGAAPPYSAGSGSPVGGPYGSPGAACLAAADSRGHGSGSPGSDDAHDRGGAGAHEGWTWPAIAGASGGLAGRSGPLSLVGTPG